MAASSSIPWSKLFQTEGRPDCHLQFLTIKRAGQTFLLLPHSPLLAARALSLYPAQTSKARLAKKALFTALRVGIPLPLETATVDFSTTDPFASFLKELANNKTGKFPSLAILAGNPNAEGRRFILLLFNESGQPVVVVKAGIGESAKQLIRKESTFLQSVPPGITGLPAFQGPFNSSKVNALALRYIEGDSPQGEDYNKIGNILTSWIDREKHVSAEDIPAWRVLKEKAPSNPLFARLSSRFAGMTFHPTLFHGDFAPWNIKVSSKDGTWTVLDWERGELIGFPAWDWFHYAIQTGILVQKLATRDLIQRLEMLFIAPEFRTYLKLSGLEGAEKILAVAYLFYCVEVLQQTEGRESAEDLLTSLTHQWPSQTA
jgi:Phosphotransferase enzyme family